MLQAPALELRAMIQAEMDRNPTLEEAPLDSTPVEIEPTNPEPEDQKALDFRKEFDTLARLDDEWRVFYRWPRKSECNSSGQFRHMLHDCDF